MADKIFTLTDPSTGKSAELPVRKGTLGPDVLGIAAMNKEHGLFTFDPGFMATASCESSITYIDGDQGVLLYR
ncbi:MAG: citrate (Si)-synthase, partial [Steroidobacteraceae bacterium]